MVGWYRIIYNTTGNWAEHRNIIVNGIKPVVDSLEKTSYLVNFFFFNHIQPNDMCVKFTFYGDKERVENEFNTHLGRRPNNVESFRPKQTDWRFEEEFPLGVKLMETASRLALCSIGNKTPIDKSSGIKSPITTVMRHFYLQNLGYNSIEEEKMAPFVDLSLYGLYNLLTIKIK